MNLIAAPGHVATRVLKNTVAQITALAATVVSKLLITVVIGRLFGPDRVGEFAFVITFTALFHFLSTGGVTWSLIREVATHREEAARYAANGLGAVIGTGLSTVPILVGLVTLMGYPSATRIAVALVGLGMAFEGMGQVVNAVFSGFERMEMGAFIAIAQEVTFLVVGTAVLWMRLPFLWFFSVYVPSRLAGFLTGWFLYRRAFGYALLPRLEMGFVLRLLRLSLPYAVNMALGPVYLRIDVVMLSLWQGNQAVGLYEAATTIFYRLNIFARTFNAALMPLLAREFEEGTGRVRRYLYAAAKYQVAFGVPLTVLCVALAGPGMRWLYGDTFRASATVFRLMALIIVVRFLNNTLANGLTATGLQTGRSLAVAWAAVVNIALNLYAIPHYSFIGATGSTILTELAFGGGLFVLLSRRVPRPLPFRALLKPVAAGLAMAGVVWGLRALPGLLLYPLALGVYLGTFVALRPFEPAEVQVVRRWIRFPFGARERPAKG